MPDSMPEKKADNVGRVLAAVNAWSDAVAAASKGGTAVQTTTPITAPLVRTQAQRADATSLLTAHAQELDRVYIALMNRALEQDNPAAMDMLARLALRCQSAIVRTIQAMSEPRTIPAWPDDAPRDSNKK